MRFGKSTNDTQQRIFGCIRAEYFSILHARCAPWIPQDSRESWSRILGSNITEYFHFHAVCDILVFSSKYTFLYHYTFVFFIHWINISSRSINCTWYILLLICVIFLFRYNRGEETYEDVQVHLSPFQTNAFRLKTHVWRCVRAFRPRLYALRFHQKMHRFKTLLKVDQNKNACISY